MKITQITTTSRYAKLTDDTSFFIQYDALLTDVERNSKWSVAYCPDLVFMDNNIQCNVTVEFEQSRVILHITNFKETLSAYSTITLRNVGCFVIQRDYQEDSEKVVLVVQTYCDNDKEEELERAIEQVM
ncbi:hypothetical protein AV274_2930 [Blastocystis sp. ATCC 50177/Nand II]|uniref:Uncharacterized protein n=1 Tax=Blastocystis sp. subtype 1 (strain ATCC 50177 / NandII) TaxID=478820 RepID=A0A196SGR0_BLAHN|nr:hypothetical protein AV274_2930 [Blastocystis sp. ATCC 50177/Nand II]